MTRPATLLCLLILAGPSRAWAQGCSDAGVCSAGPIGQLQLWQDSTADVPDYRHVARVGYTYAIGEQGTTIIQTNAELTIGIGPRLTVQAKVPFQWASGNLGENGGFGDIITTASYAFVKERHSNLTGVLGMRLPTGTTNAFVTDATHYEPLARSLPMPYQTGLGTTDLLVGINARHGHWVAALAFQHVLSNENNNGFLHLFWMDNADAQGYFESAQLERADDAVARVQYVFPIGRLVLQPGALGIYHVTKDHRLEIDQFGDRMIDVEGSDGLTLNITADARYTLGEDWALEASFGAPVITREVRPDGLTRHYVVDLGVRLAF